MIWHHRISSRLAKWKFSVVVVIIRLCPHLHRVSFFLEDISAQSFMCCRSDRRFKASTEWRSNELLNQADARLSSVLAVVFGCESAFGLNRRSSSLATIPLEGVVTRAKEEKLHQVEELALARRPSFQPWQFVSIHYGTCAVHNDHSFRFDGIMLLYRCGRASTTPRSSAPRSIA